MNEPQTILDIEWLVVEEERASTALVCAPTLNPAGVPTSPESKTRRELTNHEAFVLALAVVAIEVIVGAMLMLSGFLDTTGIVVYGIVVLIGNAMAMMALQTEPDGSAYAVCSPSRITFTGR